MANVIVVPVVANEVDRNAAGVVLGTVLAPVLALLVRHPDFNRRRHDHRRRDDHCLRNNHCRLWIAADVDPPVDAGPERLNSP
jgi:hypothetical protein